MAGEPSSVWPTSLMDLPAGFTIDQVEGRDTVRCHSCGHRWYADRMTHTANIVFLLDHRHRHVETMRDLKRCRHTVATMEVAGELRCWICGGTLPSSTSTQA